MEIQEDTKTGKHQGEKLQRNPNTKNNNQMKGYTKGTPLTFAPFTPP
jgi:hypothetical protein